MAKLETEHLNNYILLVSYKTAALSPPLMSGNLIPL